MELSRWALVLPAFLLGFSCRAGASAVASERIASPAGPEVIQRFRGADRVVSIPGDTSAIARLPAVEGYRKEVVDKPGDAGPRRSPPNHSRRHGSNHNLSCFDDRLHQFVSAAGDLSEPIDTPALPAGFVPWWQSAVERPQREGARPHVVDLDRLIIDSLRYSPQVQAIRDIVWIRDTAVVEAEAEFDVRAFMESRFVRTSEPTGDLLITGSTGRFRDQTWRYVGGLRKKTAIGGTLEISQRHGYQGNNSIFLDPRQQATSRLSFSYNLPLLNGAGREYNRSQIVLAKLDARGARDEVASQLSEHLLQVTEVYWELYMRRAALLQKQHYYERAKQILVQLDARRHVDSTRSQVLAAQAAVATRQAELNRARAAIRNAESRIRALVNAPELFSGGPQEFIPATIPSTDFVRIPLADALVTALQHRPELDLAIQETRKACTRLQMSDRELLPVLDLVLETYLAGLEGDAKFGQAWINQFRVGEPTYAAGVVFEAPLHNRAAKARHQRSRLELSMVTSRLRAVVDVLIVEVEIAVREVETSFRDIESNYRSMAATQARAEYLHDRWTLLPGDDGPPTSFLLDELLMAQERQAAAEFAFLEAQYSLSIAIVQLKHAMGTLLEIEDLPVAERIPPALHNGSPNKPHNSIPEELPTPAIEVIR